MPDRTTVKIDDRWSLADLATFSTKYNQAYSFIYSISPSVAAQEEIIRLYTQYPWLGGYSTVHFYKQLYVRTPIQDRPEVIEIRYASPGYIILAQIATVASTLGAIILGVAKGLERLSATYSQIQKDMAERKLTRLKVRHAEREDDRDELKLLQEHMSFIKETVKWFSGEMNIPEGLINVLNQRSNEEQLSQLKMLLSLYRRIEPLAELQDSGKLDVQPLIAPDDGKG